MSGSHPIPLPMLLSCLAAVATLAFTEWLRHRPHRLERGTAHIQLAGLLIAGAILLVGAVWTVWTTGVG